MFVMRLLPSIVQSTSQILPTHHNSCHLRLCQLMKCIPSNKTRKSRMFLDKFYNHTQPFCDLDASLADETEVQVVAKLEAYEM
jgi:hypothetical protein